MVIFQILEFYFGNELFASDNLITFGRNMWFLDDEKFLKAIQNNMYDGLGFSIIWRTHIVCWAAKSCRSLPGAFVECGVYKGDTSGIITEYVLAGEKKPFYLYDLFETSTLPGTGAALPGLGEGLKEEVIAKFSAHENIHVIPGHIPESLMGNHPDQVAFMHIDMNNAMAEVAALEFFWEKMSPGGIVVFDDYGWMAYQDQKKAIDEFFSKMDISVVELPTGQGMAIKR